MPQEWFDHPKYVMARERLIKTLTSPHYRFRRVGPVVFLCGGMGSQRRDTLAKFLRKQLPDLKLFYAEPVWESIAERETLGALAMESRLAELADLVIIIVESPGTFAELGAFSHSAELREKLLPIIDKQYEGQKRSFIATGPVHWVDAESRFAPTIYAPFDSILLATDEILARIALIETASARVEKLAENPKYQLLFLCDLVSIVYPAPIELVQGLYRRIVATDVNPTTVPRSLALGCAMGILKSAKVDGVTYFLPSNSAEDKTFHHLYLETLSSLRSEHISALQGIPKAVHVLTQLRG
jgi:hypothetical protein